MPRLSPRAARRGLALLVGVALACAPARPVPDTHGLPEPRDSKAPPQLIDLPADGPGDDVVYRLFVLGDGGFPGPKRDLVDEALRKRLAAHASEASIVMPGDLFYPAGLPATCVAARDWVMERYTRPLRGVPFAVVAGNHDHGDARTEIHPEIARRAAYFDCEAREAVAAEVGWTSADGCECVPGWSYPGAKDLAGARELGPVTLVTFDSQVALTQPAAVAQRLAEVLDAVPAGRRVVVMAHHPLETVGAHGKGPALSAQNLASPEYKAYLADVRPVLEERRAKVALFVGGHDHSTQWFPRASPPVLVAGAGSKTSAAGPPSDDGVAIGDAPGFAELDVRKDGSLELWLFTRYAPHRFMVPAP